MDFLISDLHLGHKNIVKQSLGLRPGPTVEDHNEWLVRQWNSVVTKHDRVWVLGDVVFGNENFKYLARMNGQKFLIRGNHDKHDITTYLKYFNNVYGFRRLNGFWISHAPIHPASLRGRFNVHGHIHKGSLPDLRYINVNVDVLNGVPMSMDQLELIMKERSGVFNEAPSEP